MTPAQIAQLRTELTTDPLPTPLGYAPFVAARRDSELAAVINFARDGATPCPVNGVAGVAVTVRRADLAVKDVYAAIDVADYTALPANPSNAQLSAERRFLAWLSGLAAMPTIRLLSDDGTDTPVVKNFKAMFAGGTQTLARLNALANRPGSRAEQLFGPGAAATIEDVAKALNS